MPPPKFLSENLFFSLLAGFILLASLSHVVRLGAWVDGLTQTKKNVVVELDSGERLKGDLQRDWDGVYLLVNSEGVVTPFRQFKSMAIPSDGQPTNDRIFTFAFPALMIACYALFIRWLWHKP
ncbi:hypothetical protein [Aeromonas hydrophila]|uniref:hypothetical protein n=1 Tax=Aeromonas hydrophila TaxID=644 RepID=UPI00224D85C1|nr:hypothetical protein [Aeromonas hydrophila]MCX4117355.1 hypothetical protein [Aeromonas hydrophila]